jgi:hypothetical protein
MHDACAAIVEDIRVTPASVGERLAREVGILASRLADLLGKSAAVKTGPLAEAQAFLRATSDSVSDGMELHAWSAGARLRRPPLTEHPLDRLARSLKLRDTEIDLLLLAGMADQHEGLAAVLRILHPRGESRVSAGMAARLLCPGAAERTHLRAILEAGPLTTSGAVRLCGDAPFFERSLELAEGLWSALHGIDAWPASLQRLQAPIVAAGLEEWLESAPAVRAARALASGEPSTIVVDADSEQRAFARALALVAHAGREASGLAMPAGWGVEYERLARLHCLVRGSVPVMRLVYGDGPGSPPAPGFAGYPDCAVNCGRTAAIEIQAGARSLIAVRAEPLSAAARRRMWAATLPRLAAQADLLASRYPIDPAMAAEIAADVRDSARLEDVGTSVRARSSLSLSGGVKLVHPSAGWKQLVLPAASLQQLREAVARLSLQSRVLDDWGFLKGRPGARGVRMLFAGPPGTGKTLSAEVMACALDVDLLVVDISRVVSKWIGETEKNLAQVFDAAERAQAVLFFDEADALFGKRTEVSDAHDRYANLETAYLLARLERFEGLAVLATNLRQNIDPAFLRRLDFVMDYTEPDRDERCALWRCHLPAAAPLVDDLNVTELGTLYPVVGGFIRNAAVSAAFLAAEEGTAISRAHCLRAIRREYEKSGRAFPGAPPGTRIP